MSISVQTNLTGYFSNLTKKFDHEYGKEAFDAMLREIAVTTAGTMRERIHEKGLDSNNQQIGTYSKGYMVVRTGAYKNATKTKKGKYKDSGTYTDRTIKLDKNTGVFTGEDKIGKARPKYNRTSDTKVVASLTRQMESDFTLGKQNPNPDKTDKGYSIGWKNQHNADKAGWVEETYKKVNKIFTPSKKEIADIYKMANEFSKRAAGKI